MTTEFIPYEEALALKELGFTQSGCYADYRQWDGNKPYLYLYQDWNPEDTESYTKECEAPLYQQAFRWFRGKGYLISVDSITSTEHEFYIKWNSDKSVLSDQYSTYEEAELECLRKLINLVKEKKNGI